jgi:DNA-binding NarL/FixJ family response regulator
VQRTSLTKREVQVLELLIQGKADKDIAAALNLTVRTVRFHVSHIFIKKGVNTRAELLACELGRSRG